MFCLFQRGAQCLPAADRNANKRTRVHRDQNRRRERGWKYVGRGYFWLSQIIDMLGVYTWGGEGNEINVVTFSLFLLLLKMFDNIIKHILESIKWHLIGQCLKVIAIIRIKKTSWLSPWAMPSGKEQCTVILCLENRSDRLGLKLVKIKWYNYSPGSLLFTPTVPSTWYTEQQCSSLGKAHLCSFLSRGKMLLGNCCGARSEDWGLKECLMTADIYELVLCIWTTLTKWNDQMQYFVVARAGN